MTDDRLKKKKKKQTNKTEIETRTENGGHCLAFLWLL